VCTVYRMWTVPAGRARPYFAGLQVLQCSWVSVPPGTWPWWAEGGDARAGSVKRVASAAGAGAIAVHLVHEYLSEERG
jgi:hypothetical protein